MRHDDGLMVVVGGVRVRRDEAGALGLKIPSAPAPAPEITDDEPTDPKKPAGRKARTPANKQRRNVENK